LGYNGAPDKGGVLKNRKTAQCRFFARENAKGSLRSERKGRDGKGGSREKESLKERRKLGCFREGRTVSFA